MFINPFDAAGEWYKGNLHTHTTHSDGERSPQEVVNWYRCHGYDFLAITDHSKLTDVSKFTDPEFLTMGGTEFNVDRTEMGQSYHLVALDLPQEIELFQGIGAQTTIDRIRSEGGEVIVAHPYWSGLTINELLPLQGPIGLEVFNTTCLKGIGKGLSSVHWDNLLARGRRVWGFAVDDAHFHRPDAGGGWIMVKAPKLNRDDIMNAIRGGLFYSSCGPEIMGLRVADDTISVECSPIIMIHFICNLSKGRSFQAEEDGVLTGAEFKLSGEENYLRIECIDQTGRKAWTNPLFLK
jgi:hypothetical protein